jgi:hypothetical protein
MPYAEKTAISSIQSRADIEKLLTKHGAEQFGYMSRSDSASIAFVLHNRQVRFTIPLPDRNDREFTHHSRGTRTASAAEDLYEQAVKQKWRALLLVTKAKLEAVEAGISTFDEEFLAHFVTSQGDTVGDRLIPSLDVALTHSSRLELEA